VKYTVELQLGKRRRQPGNCEWQRQIASEGRGDAIFRIDRSLATCWDFSDAPCNLPCEAARGDHVRAMAELIIISACNSVPLCAHPHSAIE
jgi:hypothetical protein